MDSKKSVVALVVAVAAFCVVAGGALMLANAQITGGYLEVIGNQATGYASAVAQQTHLADAQVTRLKNMTYDELLASEENQEFGAMFAESTLSSQIDYAYVMVKLDPDEVRYRATEETAEYYDAPVGTPFDLLWLLDVTVSSSGAGSLVPTDGTSFDDMTRYGYFNEHDETIFAQAPTYVVNDDEWGRHICGYAPLYSEEGTYIGVVGVDLSVTAYDNHASMAVTVLIALLLAIAAALLIIFVLLTRQHRRDELKMRLQDERYKILIDTTNTPTFDYDPISDVIAYSVFDVDGRLRERIVKGYLRNLAKVSAVDHGRLDEFRSAIERGCESAHSGIVDFRADMGQGMRWYKARFASVADDRGRVYRVVGRLDDIQREKDIEQRADRDALSGVLNRAGAEERMREMFARPDSRAQASFILIDIDDFKTINDTQGHAGGDAVIRHVGETLSTLFRREDVVYRLGGDEFAVLLQAPDLEGLVRTRADALLYEVAAYSESLGWDFSVSVSIGIGLATQASTTFDELYKAADDALYESKRGGKGRYTIRVLDTASADEGKARFFASARARSQ